MSKSYLVRFSGEIEALESSFNTSEDYRKALLQHNPILSAPASMGQEPRQGTIMTVTTLESYDVTYQTKATKRVRATCPEEAKRIVAHADEDNFPVILSVKGVDNG